MKHAKYLYLPVIAVLALGLTLTVSAFSPAAASAAESASASVAFVQKLGDKALSSLTAKNIAEAERQKRVRALLHDNFDLQTIGRFALGTYWKDATDAQKAEYFKLFEDMIVKTYSQRFAEYSGQSFKVGGEIPVSDNDTMVSSQILQKDGPPVNVEWRVRHKNGEMKIVDVKVENISMSVTQRSDFAAVIEKGGGGVDALLKALRERKNLKQTAQD